MTIVSHIQQPPFLACAEGIQIDFLEASRRNEAMSLWRTLETQIDSDRLTSSSVWTECWLDHYGDLVRHRFAVGTLDGQVEAVCLVTAGAKQKDGPVPVRTTHLGTAGEPDAESVCVEYNHLLTTPSARTAFPIALWTHLTHDATWDSAHWDGFAEEELEALAADDPQLEVVCKKAWYFDLHAARQANQEPYERFDASMQRQIRRKLKAVGDVTLEWAEQTDDALRIFDELVLRHQARWTSVGEPGSYASDRFHAFHRDLVARLVPAGRMVLCRVIHEGETLACSQLLVDGNRLLMYQGGWNPEKLRLSPGFIADYLCLSEAGRRGYDAYDFLAGESDHKRRFSTDFQNLVWLRARRPKLKFTLLNLIRRAKRVAQQVTVRGAAAE